MPELPDLEYIASRLPPRLAGRTVTEVVVRDHVKVRNRKDLPCPVCGTKIRRAGVLGYDSFFCPRCQAASRPQRIPW